MWNRLHKRSLNLTKFPPRS